MVKCGECEEVFEEDELEEEEFDMGECFGFSTSETWGKCPYCGSNDIEYDYVEIEEYEEDQEDEYE